MKTKNTLVSIDDLIVVSLPISPEEIKKQNLATFSNRQFLTETIPVYNVYELGIMNKSKNKFLLLREFNKNKNTIRDIDGIKHYPFNFDDQQYYIKHSKCGPIPFISSYEFAIGLPLNYLRKQNLFLIKKQINNYVKELCLKQEKEKFL